MGTFDVDNFPLFFLQRSIFAMENGSLPSKTEGIVSRMALNDNKAGMEGLDREKINKIIMEASKVFSAVHSNLPLYLWVNDQET